MTLERRKETAVATVRRPLRERVHTIYVTHRAAAVTVGRRRAWTVWQRARQLPMVMLLLIRYSPRGLRRSLAAYGRWVRDDDSARLRSHHAEAKDADAYTKASMVRSKNLRPRVLGSIAGALALCIPVLMWAAPEVLGVFVAVATVGCVLKAAPRLDGNWLLGAGVAGVVAYVGTPRLAALVPPPTAWLPEWLAWTLAALVVGVLGWVGRPLAKPLVTVPGVEIAGMAPRLTAPMVMAALCALGNGKMKLPDDIKLLNDPHRHGQGYQVDLELPPGVTADWVIEQRAELAAALRRELGCVWPSVGLRHPGHLALFVSDVPMSTARQAPWPLLSGQPVNLWEAVPLFTDQRGQWVLQVLMYTGWVVGAVPRMGKTVALRILGLIAAFEVRAKLFVFDLKGTGDLSALAQVAHAYGVGDEPEDIDDQLQHMRRVRQEMRARTKLVRELTLEENPDRGKVTDALARRDPAKFGPIVVIVDECQVWFQELDDKEMRAEFIQIARDLVKRGPALGIIPIFATQKPDAKSIPSAIADNASARLCLKVNGQISNDQILGTSSYRDGIRATQFAFSEKGVAYFRGDGAEPLVVRTVFGVDATMADDLAARARAMRAAAGLLTGEAAGEVELPMADIVADVEQVMVDRARDAAHFVELVVWLRELRPGYASLDERELSKRLRNERVAVTKQLKIEGRNLSGVRYADLRKEDEDDE